MSADVRAMTTLSGRCDRSVVRSSLTASARYPSAGSVAEIAERHYHDRQPWRAFCGAVGTVYAEPGQCPIGKIAGYKDSEQH